MKPLIVHFEYPDNHYKLELYGYNKEIYHSCNPNECTIIKKGGHGTYYACPACHLPRNNDLLAFLGLNGVIFGYTE